MNGPAVGTLGRCVSSFASNPCVGEAISLGVDGAWLRGRHVAARTWWVRSPEYALVRNFLHNAPLQMIGQFLPPIDAYGALHWGFDLRVLHGFDMCVTYLVKTSNHNGYPYRPFQTLSKVLKFPNSTRPPKNSPLDLKQVRG
jgi:hypothetical protein